MAEPQNDHISENALPDQNAIFGENSERVIATDGSGSESLVIRLMARYKISEETALDIVDEVREEFSPSTKTGDNARRAQELIQRLVGALARLIVYPGDKAMFARAIALRLGFNDIAGGKTLVDVAKACSTKKHIVGKFTFLKCFNCVEDAMNLPQYAKLPELPGQRDESARNNMRTSRIAQLKS
jgi:hypothetical protein